MKIVGFMRTWNEKDIIREVVDRNMEVLDDLIVLDKGSTDGTWDILQQTGLQHVYRIDLEDDWEVEDRLTGYHMARMLKPDWVFNVDSDEIIWTLKRPLREILADVPEDVDVLDVQVFDFFWNKNDPEPFIYDGNLSIVENRKYVPVGNRWVSRVARPRSYVTLHLAFTGNRRKENLNDIVYRHYSRCVNPERTSEKLVRYREVESARVKEGIDMSFLPVIEKRDHFGVPPVPVVEFTRIEKDRDYFLPWREEVQGRQVWAHQLKGE